MIDEVAGYRILERVGEGGFSVVYRALQERLDRLVALKVLSVDAVDSDTMRRFERECRITGRLTGHPNVVTVLDTGMTNGGRPFIAMDYFERGSLSDQLSRTGPLAVPDVLRIGVKIAGALAATHEADVLHRDVKPQNILVSKYGEPALADFGIARLVSTSEATHTTAFTPHHAAPEVVNGLPPGVASDIYALASSMYQLLAGNPAFKSGSRDGIGPLMMRILNEPPPPIQRADVPPMVFEAIAKAMAKSPGDRYPTAVAFAGQLQRLQLDLGLPVSELAGSDLMPAPALPISRPAGPSGVTAPSVDLPAGRPEAFAPFAPSNMAHPATVAPPTPLVAAQAKATLGLPASVPHAPHGFPAQPVTQEVMRGGTQITGPAAGTEERRGPVLVGALVVVILVGAGAGLGGLLMLGGGKKTSTPPRTPVAAPPPRVSPSPPYVPSRVMRAATPRSVRASARGPVVILAWKLAKNNNYPILVQQADETGSQAPQALPKRTMSTTIGGLDPVKGYCFTVGTIVALGQVDGQPAAIAWSKPVCVRGASIN
jgi:serine/threonine protein kinase